MMLPKSCQKAAAKPADAKTAAFLTVHAKRVVIPARSAILLTKARTKSAWKARERPMRPLISVLIPVYQVEGYLGRCLDSVLAQTYPDLEICMVDDGSTDGSAEIGQRYVEQAPMPVGLSRAEHLGVSHARQRLLEQAKGEYLFFLDSDDFLHPQTIETLYRLAVRHGADIVQCKMGHTSEDAMPPMDIDNPDERVYPDREQVMVAFLSADSSLRVMLAGKLYRREMLQGIRFPVGRIHEDEAVMHRIMDRAEAVVTTDLPLYRYYTNLESITKGSFSYARYDALDANLDRIRYCYGQGYEFFAKMNCLYYCVNCLDLYRRTRLEISPADPHLPWLLEKYRAMAAYFISTGLPEPGLSQALRGWMEEPMVGELPSYFATVREYWHMGKGELRAK